MLCPSLVSVRRCGSGVDSESPADGLRRRGSARGVRFPVPLSLVPSALPQGLGGFCRGGAGGGGGGVGLWLAGGVGRGLFDFSRRSGEFIGARRGGLVASLGMSGFLCRFCWDSGQEFYHFDVIGLDRESFSCINWLSVFFVREPLRFVDDEQSVLLTLAGPLSRPPVDPSAVPQVDHHERIWVVREYAVPVGGVGHLLCDAPSSEPPVWQIFIE